MPFSAAVLLSFSKSGSVKRTVRGIFALLSSLSILNTLSPLTNIIPIYGISYITLSDCIYGYIDV